MQFSTGRSLCCDTARYIRLTHSPAYSRRMYYAHLKEWGFHKNLKAAEKDHLDAILSKSSNPTISAAFTANENFRRRIERHRKSKKSQESFRHWNPPDPSICRKAQSSPTPQPSHIPGDSLLLSSTFSRSREHLTARVDTPAILPDLELVLRCIKSLCSFRGHTKVSSRPPDHGLADWPVDSFRRFWGNLGYGIHLLKVSSSVDRAFSAISQACEVAPAALTTDTFTFVVGLLTTLSPVNNITRPGLRASLLRYLGQLSKHKLGPDNPLHLICNELLHDGTGRAFSEAVLSFMLAHQTSTVGDRHSSVLRLRTALVASKLRDGDYSSAFESGSDLISTCKAQCDPGSMSENFAVGELEQALLVQGQCANSLDTCLSIIWICNNTLSLSAGETVDVLSDASPADTHGALLIDNTAKIDELTRAPEARAMWLRRAAGVARALWGDCEGYRQVAERLAMVIKKEGKHVGPEVSM